MPEQSFHIQSAVADQLRPEDTRLILEAGETHLVVLLSSLDKGSIVALHYYQFPANEAPDAYSGILQTDELVRRPVAQQWIVSHYRENVLVPSVLYSGEGADRVLAMVHGDLRRGTPMTDTLDALGIQNLHRMPEDVEDLLRKALPDATFRHESSLVLQWLNEQRDMLPSVYLYLQVFPNQVSVTVMRDGISQLVQTYPYDIPEDLSYHLLNTCEQLDLDPDTIPVIVSGLIDPSSPLYLELHKYFRHLETQPAAACSAQDEAFADVPAHYFTPQNILSVCA